MTPIRVHFGPMPEMLRTIMHDLLSREADIAISGSSMEREDCMRAARAGQAEIVLVQDQAQEGGSCLDLMLARQSFGLFAVSTDGHSATSVRLARRPVTLNSNSPSSLADAIRGVAAELRAATLAPGKNGAAPSNAGAGSAPDH